MTGVQTCALPIYLIDATIESSRAEAIVDVPVMAYNLSRYTVRIKDVNTGNILQSTGASPQYEKELMSGNKLKIKFLDRVGYSVKYEIIIYVPTNMGSEVRYGGTPPVNTETYLGKYIQGSNQANITVALAMTHKTGERTLESGEVEELWGSSITNNYNVMLKYTEIAKIN